MTARYEALVRVSEALRRYHDTDALFRSLGHELQPVVHFDLLGLALLDEATGGVSPRVLSSAGTAAEPPLLTTKDQLTHRVIATRRPFVIPDIAEESGFAEEVAYLRALGMRAVCCLPLETPQRLVGMLLASSAGPRDYEDADVSFLALVANQVALAIDDAESHSALRTSLELQRSRLQQLEAADDLLRTLSTALDIREVFQRVSEIARPLLPHDLLSLPLLTSDRNSVIVHAYTGTDVEFPSIVPLAARWRLLLSEPWEHLITDDLRDSPDQHGLPPAMAGYRARLVVPIRLSGELIGALDFFSFEVGANGPDDAVVARRIADYVALALAHQRLAEESRRVETLRERETSLGLLDQLLASVTDAGSLPDIWDRVSAVVQTVLPHDALLLSALLPDGVRGRVYASVTSGEGRFPEIVHVPPAALRNPDWDHEVVDDLQSQADQKHLESTKLGYRSVIRLPLRLDGEHVAALSVLSFTPRAYSHDDVVTAKRVATRVLQSFAKERRERLRVRADEATERAARLEARVKSLTEELDARTGYRRVVGESPGWSLVLRQATQVAATDTTVLLLGESGTGKEVVARFLHRASARADGPFVALNCAALPEQLLESELFGHERGAFTGAIAAKPGLIEQAAGGVLFLDEVSEMPASAQAKFLRVLQEREFQRVGGTRPLKANIRVIAATNRDLPSMIERGLFREDLYYRLHVFEIALPPLRARRDDILPLSRAFLHEIAQSFGRPPAGISREAHEIRQAYDWPGNVRQLRNALERAAILCEGGLITGEHLSLPQPRPLAATTGPSPAASSAAAPPPASSPVVSDLASLERTAIEQALVETRYNKAKAARLLGLTRTQLYVRLRKHGLE